MRDDSFLTTEELLEYLQVNLRTVYRLIKAGKLPAVRVGRQWRFRKSDLDAWLESERPRTARSAQAQSSSSPGGPTAQTERPRILVVDDEASIRDLLSKTLALADYDVDVAPDGRSAVERLRMLAYDLTQHRSEDARHGRSWGHSRGTAAESRPARDHHHGVLDRSQCHRGGQLGRRRLPDETLPCAPGLSRGRQSAR